MWKLESTLDDHSCPSIGVNPRSAIGCMQCDTALPALAPLLSSEAFCPGEGICKPFVQSQLWTGHATESVTAPRPSSTNHSCTSNDGKQVNNRSPDFRPDPSDLFPPSASTDWAICSCSATSSDRVHKMTAPQSETSETGVRKESMATLSYPSK